MSSAFSSCPDQSSYRIIIKSGLIPIGNRLRDLVQPGLTTGCFATFKALCIMLSVLFVPPVSFTFSKGILQINKFFSKTRINTDRINYFDYLILNLNFYIKVFDPGCMVNYLLQEISANPSSLGRYLLWSLYRP